ncbi:beta-ketoacyl reductase, partial [Actinomadura sediminis]
RLAADGAAHLVLVSRRGLDAAGARDLADELAAAGTRVTVAACDVADRDALRDLLDGLPEPVTAVVHAAGVLPEPGPLTGGGGRDALAAAAPAKVAGARNLDELLGDRPLEAFVLFSSGAAVWGSAGQAAYAGANAYLDALAARRRARGRAATCVAWGSWGGGGMVDEGTAAYLRRLGVDEMPPELAVRALWQALAHDEPHLVVTDTDWARFVPPYTLGRARPLLDDLPDARAAAAGGDAADAEPGDGADLADRLAGLTPPERERVLLDLVRSLTAALLGHDVGDVEPGRAFKDLGFDSVAAVEFRNRLSRAAGVRLPATLVFDHPTAAAIAAHLAAALSGGAGTAAAGGGSAPLPARLDRLKSELVAVPPAAVAAVGLLDRLRAMTARLGAAAGDDPAAGVESRLADADADDVLAFIDKEFGAR